MKDSGDGLAMLFALAVKAISYGAKTGAEAVEGIVNKEVKKGKIREKLNILEYAENAKNKKNYYTPDDDDEDTVVGLIQVKDPDFKKEMFEHYAEDIFRKFMKAYSDNDLDSVRKYVDINLIELFKMQSGKNNNLKEKEELNIKNFNYVDIFGYHKEGEFEVVSVALGINYYDYIKNAQGDVIKGSDKNVLHTVYLLSFSRKQGGKTIDNIKDYKDGKAYCPNCGGEITNSYSECEHCHTILYNSTENWLLTHIEEM